MEFVTVALHVYKDSTFINGTITNEKGEFKIEKINLVDIIWYCHLWVLKKHFQYRLNLTKKTQLSISEN